MPSVIDNTGLSFTAQVQASLAPWADPAGAWQGLNAAYGAMFDQIWPLVADHGSPDEPGYVAGWSTLLDPSTCPTQFLPFLGQFVGVFIAPGTDDQTARRMIVAESAFNRGTPQAMIAAAQRNLTGSQQVTLRERVTVNNQPDAYHALVVFDPAECPSVPALVQAVTAVKPAGIQLSFVAATGLIWDLASGTWSQQTGTWAND